MQVILDSNVLLSALISPYSPPHTIYTAWRKGRFELVTCREQIEEIQRASRYPGLRKYLHGHQVGTLINRLNELTLVQPASEPQVQLGDPDDLFLVALAETSQSDWLITGDRHSGLLKLGHCGRTRIAEPAVFCREALHG